MSPKSAFQTTLSLASKGHPQTPPRTLVERLLRENPRLQPFHSHTEPSEQISACFSEQSRGRCSAGSIGLEEAYLGEIKSALRAELKFDERYFLMPRWPHRALWVTGPSKFLPMSPYLPQVKQPCHPRQGTPEAGQRKT